ncbi:MAG: PTS transporter subunit EIIC, partial [Cetobacterium sp.]
MKFEKLNNFLETKFVPIAAKIGENRYLQSVRDGLLVTMPFLMIGSIFMILANFPIAGYAGFMARIFGDTWKNYFILPSRATFDLVAVFASLSIAYNLAKRYSLDPLSVGITSVASFVLSTPISIFSDGKLISDRALSLTYTSSRGLFVAIIIAITVTEICRVAIKRNWVIKMPDSVPPAVSKSFTAIIPSGIALIAIWSIRYALSTTS